MHNRWFPLCLLTAATSRNASVYSLEDSLHKRCNILFFKKQDHYAAALQRYITNVSYYFSKQDHYAYTKSNYTGNGSCPKRLTCVLFALCPLASLVDTVVALGTFRHFFYSYGVWNARLVRNMHVYVRCNYRHNFMCNQLDENLDLEADIAVTLNWRN